MKKQESHANAAIRHFRNAFLAMCAFSILSVAGTGVYIYSTNRNYSAGAQQFSCTRTITSGSISTAVNALSSGQTLCLTGAFNQSVNITKAGVGLASTPGQTARIIGQLKISPGANNVRILNLYLNGNGIIVSPHVLANNALFYGNQVTNQGATRGICFAIGETDIGVEVQGITLDSNRIFRCGTVYHDQGIYAEYVRDAVIRNNYIYDNPDFGIQFYPSAQNSIFEYNVLDNNKRGLTYSSEGSRTSSGNIVRYNIITNSADAYNLAYYWGGPVGTGNRADNNCLFNGGKGNIQPGLTNYVAVSGTITADPMYIDRPNKDFRLKSGSPCAAMGPRTASVNPVTPPQSPPVQPVPVPLPAPQPTPPSPTPSVPAPSPSASPITTVPGANSLQPVPIPTTLTPDSNGVFYADFNGDGQEDSAQDTNLDGAIDPLSEIIVGEQIDAPATSNDGDSALKNIVSIKFGPLPEVKVPKVLFAIFLAATCLAFVGIWGYLTTVRFSFLYYFQRKFRQR